MKHLTVSVPDEARCEAMQRQVQSEIVNFRAGDRLNRDEVHDRAVR